VENRTMPLGGEQLSGILTLGGTILGTSRDKPHKMPMDGEVRDMTEQIVANYHAHQLDALVCLGGGGTQKNALRLLRAGLNVVTLPKTIDNDVAMTDITFGFDTALGIATDAIDRLHSTAHSHHRIIVVEIMGHRAGWLALGAGIAGGADVILIPEIPYDIEKVCAKIEARRASGRNFSLVVVAESVRAVDGEVQTYTDAHGQSRYGGIGRVIAEAIARRTGAESRVTVLGHVQRGGSPVALDRVLGAAFGVHAVDLVAQRRFDRVVGWQNRRVVDLPLAEACAAFKAVDPHDPLVWTARGLGISFGD
jgi:6-phosphofructokinase 1